MITEDDLRQAIAECQGERNPNANTCIKLAAYYTILDNIKPETVRDTSSYAFSAGTSSDIVNYTRNTEFSRLIDGKDTVKVLEVVDELMQTLKMVLPQLHSSTVQKIRNKTQ